MWCRTPLISRSPKPNHKLFSQKWSDLLGNRQRGRVFDAFHDETGGNIPQRHHFYQFFVKSVVVRNVSNLDAQSTVKPAHLNQAGPVAVYLFQWEGASHTGRAISASASARLTPISRN